MTTRSPLRNRVTPFGELEATSARGLFFGNRGCLHDDAGDIVRRATTKGWIICLLEFKGRRRALMQPGKYTELFFLDEPTALAAGHRPCAECRRADYNRFRRAVADDEGAADLLRAPELDARLDVERRAGRPIELPVDELPDGVMIALDNAAHLWWRGQLRRWTHAGYRPAAVPPPRVAPVLTPSTSLMALRGGYEPMVHRSIDR